MYRSDNGGNSWNQIAGYYNIDEIHVDHHAMYIDEITGRIFEGNDGGLYISDNFGNDWQKINTLGITQFYDVEIDYLMPHRLYGGTQDNNTIRTLTGATNSWQAILGGDGFYSLVDYTNNNIIYAESQWGNLSKSTDGWNFNDISGYWQGDQYINRVNWSAPLVMHPEDPDTLYFGTYRIWKTSNGGSSWIAVSDDLTQGGSGSFHTITTLATSSINPNIVLAGSADGRVHISTNAGFVIFQPIRVLDGRIFQRDYQSVGLLVLKQIPLMKILFTQHFQASDGTNLNRMCLNQLTWEKTGQVFQEISLNCQ